MENAQPEPSMEEILASIRRIISEDDEGAAEDAPSAKSAPPSRPAKPSLVKARTEPEAAAEDGPAPTQETSPDDSEDDRANPHLETEDVEMIKQNVAEAIQEDAGDAILDRDAEEAASSAFQSLSQSVRVSDHPGRSLEDIVTEMLRPMVKEWLNENLPAIVEEKVEEEVQRVARRRR